MVAMFPSGDSVGVFGFNSGSWGSGSGINHGEGWHSSGFAGAVSGGGAVDESNFNVLHVFNRLVHGVKFLEHLDTGFGSGGGGTDESKGEFHA